MSDSTLEDVLSGKEPVDVPQEEKVEAEAQESETDEPVEEAKPDSEVEDSEPTGDVEEKPSKTEPPSVETTKEVPLAAMLDERDKRKALQAELEKIRAEQEKAQKEKVDFWENPEKALESMEQNLRGEFQQTLTNSLLAFSIQSASYRHPDYDQFKDAFAQAAEQNPTLVDQALQSNDPGEYIYSVGKQFHELDSFGGNIETMKEKLRAEIKAELMAKQGEKETKLKSVPTPLTDETSAMAPRDKVEGGPTPLENIFNYNRG